MKKWIALLLTLVLLLSMTACSSSTESDRDDEDRPAESEAQETTQDAAIDDHDQTTAGEDSTEGEHEDIPEFVAEDYDVTGTCGENAKWGFKEATGELTIIGTGKMEDYALDADTFRSSFPLAI